ncbi:Adenylate cyclase, class 3 [Alkalispirochaeta americana]|uniref:Adenylate cyclase, class 3 n=1 Tax=Alkalispirochaeta americana TaxID=159291 RepID=A0A1N6XVE8_9SPIO|nr:adenylate/guanylate cyclase domain-containing protein [Alkalispirochaeta americana]SIR06375.1 Adenylate cyclase, class 3 [Alkalispirochaeta americana]
MYSLDYQNKLYKRFVDQRVRKSIFENFSLENLDIEIDKKESFTNVIYIDIYSFSETVSEMTASDIKNYLEEYYSKTLRIIHKYSGRIDKLMGDGIIAMFSPLFDRRMKKKDASNNALYCSKEIIEELFCTEFESKSAIGSGDLYYCKTGLEQVYEEYTAIGKPLTIAYRLEAEADKNQILTLKRTGLSKRILSQEIDMSGWSKNIFTSVLKGLGDFDILSCKY